MSRPPPVRGRPAPCATSGRKPSGKSSRKSSSGSKAWIWWLVGGGAPVVLLICGGGAVAFLSGVKKAFDTASTPDVPLGDPNQLFPLADVPVPEFPPLGAPTSVLQPSGVQVYFVDFGSIPTNADQPGMRMKMRVYVPSGDHAARSLGCVLVAPAGTILLTGCDLDINDDYHDETLPYAEAGMVAVFYSLDGGVPESETVNEQFRDAYLKFRARPGRRGQRPQRSRLRAQHAAAGRSTADLLGRDTRPPPRTRCCSPPTSRGCAGASPMRRRRTSNCACGR